jgi:hypothetical protein
MSRQRLTPELAERLGLSQQVVNELVTEAVVIQGAATEGVRVSDDELRATIQQIREFQDSGRFSRDEYLKVLRCGSIREFENEVLRHSSAADEARSPGVKVSTGDPQAYRSGTSVRAAWVGVDGPVMPRCRWQTRI